MSEENRVSAINRCIRDGFSILRLTVNESVTEDSIVHYEDITDEFESNSGWVSVEKSTPEDCQPVGVKVVARFKHYKPTSQQAKSGIIGRWQLHNSYAWNNTDIEITHFEPPKDKEQS